jgi:hypothetical protein
VLRALVSVRGDAPETRAAHRERAEAHVDELLWVEAAVPVPGPAVELVATRVHVCVCACVRGAVVIGGGGVGVRVGRAATQGSSNTQHVTDARATHTSEKKQVVRRAP